MDSCKTCLYRYLPLDEEPCSECKSVTGCWTKYKPTPPAEWSDATYYEIIEAIDSRLLDELSKVKPDGTHGSILSPGLMVASGIIQELHLRRTKHD